LHRQLFKTFYPALKIKKIEKLCSSLIQAVLKPFDFLII